MDAELAFVVLFALVFDHDGFARDMPHHVAFEGFDIACSAVLVSRSQRLV